MRIATIVAFAVILVLLYLLSNRPSGSRQELEKQAQILRDSLDVRNARERDLKALDSTIVRKMALDMDSLKTALNASNAKQRKYAQIKPLILPTDAELDGKIATLYGYRRHL